MSFPSLPPASPTCSRDRAAALKPTVYLPRDRVRVCPECAGPLIRASACVTCPHCGWGHCG